MTVWMASIPVPVTSRAARSAGKSVRPVPTNSVHGGATSAAGVAPHIHTVSHEDIRSRPRGRDRAARLPCDKPPRSGALGTEGTVSHHHPGRLGHSPRLL